MRFILGFLLFSLSGFAQVENWGGPVDRLEGLLGMGFTCDPADRAEVEYIDCQIPGLKVTRLTDEMNFDQLSEELIFLEATRRNHQFVGCQRKLHVALEDPEERKTLKKNAFLQFRAIREELGAQLSEKSAAEETVDTFRPANFAEDRFNTRYNDWRAERLARAQRELATVEGKLQSLVARIPLGNRRLVKEKMIDLFKTNPEISEESFGLVFEGLLGTLESQVTQSESFFDGIKVPQADGTFLYTVDDDLKLSLIKLGQVNNVVSSLDMKERLAKSFVCRSRARYERGPLARKALEVPLYFAGAYGLGRLAARAGASIITATSARAAMIGLDAIEGVRAFDETMDACFPDEFLAGSLDESCSGESEIASVYQESDIASCVTTGVLNVAPVALVGGVRLWARTSARMKVKAPPERAPEENVIVVTARRDRLTTRAKAEPPRAPEEITIPRVSQNKITLTTDRIRELKLPGRDYAATVNYVSDEKLREGIVEAMRKMNDPDALADYVGELQADTFRAMLASSEKSLHTRAQWGKLDKETMLNVLRARVEARGAKIVEIKKSEGVLSDEAFNQRIGQGYLIDRGFPEGMAHGTYTHLLQQDMAYDIISRVSGKSHLEIIDFFGTPEGAKVWGSVFDNTPKMPSPNSPEFFRKNIMEKNIPLGLRRGTNPPGPGTHGPRVREAHPETRSAYRGVALPFHRSLDRSRPRGIAG